MSYYCKHCGALLPEGARLCPVCSTPSNPLAAPAAPAGETAAPQQAGPACPPPAGGDASALPAGQDQSAQQPAAPLLQNAWAPGPAPHQGPLPEPPKAEAEPESPRAPHYASHVPPPRPPLPHEETGAHSSTPGCELTTGQYFLTLLVLAVPLVGLIMGFIWAFSTSTEEARRRLARAYLLRTAVLVAVLIVLALALTLLAALFYQLAYGYYNPYYGIPPRHGFFS